eukprot:6200448-Pleurochrysis_carterae.AAC.1
MHTRAQGGAATHAACMRASGSLHAWGYLLVLRQRRRSESGGGESGASHKRRRRGLLGVGGVMRPSHGMCKVVLLLLLRRRWFKWRRTLTGVREAWAYVLAWGLC